MITSELQKIIEDMQICTVGIQDTSSESYDITINATGGYKDKSNLKYQEYTFQLIVARPNYADAEILANQLFDELVSFTSRKVEGFNDGVNDIPESVISITPIQSPSYFGMQERGYATFIFNVTVLKDKKHKKT